MNIYSLEFIKSSYELTGVHYVLRADRHEESLYLSYKENTDNSKEKKHYFTHNAPLLSSWMQVLDYGAADDVKSEVAFQKLKKIRDILPVKKIKDPAKLAIYLEKLSADQITEMIESVLIILKEAFELRPSLAFLYKDFYTILSLLMDYQQNRSTPGEIASSLDMLLFSLWNDIDNLSEEYDSAKEYCEAVFLTENTPGSYLSTENLASLYHNYCMESRKTDFSVDFGERIAFSMIPVENMSWKSYLEKHKGQYAPSNEKTEQYSIYAFTQFLHIGIDHMISSDSVLRVCKLCGGYFRIKYSSSQEYCTRLYGDTKAACNEYASRKSYKEKLFQHPIHQEFTKAYNKLYGRIRRGKLPADTPLMDQLKKLHDEYYEKYENTHHKDREEVWKEYIEKNKELLA